MDTCIKYGMPACEYHAHPALSQSVLKRMAKEKSLKHFKRFMDEGEPDKPAFAFGRAFHTAILEPEKFEASVIVFDETKTRSSKAFDKFEAANQGKDILLPDEFEMIRGMRESFYNHPIARHIITGAAIEASCFWQDQATGVDCRARLDILALDMVWDVKTARDASYEGFKKDADTYGYHRQAPWYIDAAEATTGRKMESFGFVVVEKEPPFEIQIFIYDQDKIEEGRAENRRDLATFAICQKNNDWPGYPQTIQTLGA